MMLHIPTLLIVSIFIFSAMGLLTFHAWSRDTRDRTLAYLGAMMLLAALGVVLFSTGSPEIDMARIIFANIVLLLGAAMGWTAMRVFAGRKPCVAGIVAGPLLWLALCAVPAFQNSVDLRVFIYSLAAVAYTGATAAEIWNSRKTLGVSYFPALILTLVHTIFYALRSVSQQAMDLDQVRLGTGPGAVFFSFMLFESMMYIIGIGYVTLSMVKERAELRLKAAAYSDPLTEIGNRRAFMQHGQTLLDDCRHRGSPAALLLCDLDHFKRLNDTFGHPMGDQVLIAFSKVGAASTRKQDVLARIGGEEFACLLADTDAARAINTAEQIRQRYGKLNLFELGQLSVSIGVATTDEAGYELAGLLSLADEALYAAKGKGRNRVQIASRPRQDDALIAENAA
ncbi:GGDEF domain-containing protein [Pigmentiphaga aceris]|uniref:diguanylate cyclase n=1 Tax=Pigmentiphaga aceris TaxID=1940612 RepID=A0A5C0B4J7_9BURK|nr:GGDEF domain-containing protein [Pigmentiphaga aceris]QEI07761.1 GGDEF domain-containing protein [Pigmentiphaga aceris]